MAFQALGTIGYVLFAAEATSGVDQIDIDLNANTEVVYQLVETCDVTPVASLLRPGMVSAYQDVQEHSYVKEGGSVSMTGYLTGKESAAGDPPVWRAVLLASNLAETINVGTSAVYNVATERQSSMTVVRHNGELETSKERMKFTTGTIGSVKFMFAVGDFAKWEFSGEGIGHNVLSDDLEYFDATGKPLLDNTGAAITYTGTYGRSTKDLMVCKSVTLTIGGVSYCVSSASFDIAFGSSIVACITGDTSRQHIINTRGGDAPVTMNITLEDGGSALDDMLSKYPAGTTFAAALSITDGTDTVAISMPNSQFGIPAPGDDGGRVNWSVDIYGAVNSSAGNDSFTITFT